MKKLFYTLVLLFAASITLTSCDDRIIISGTQWASHNVKQHYTHESMLGYFTWEQARTVCPHGWRLPTREELQSLVNADSEWTSFAPYGGRIFGSRGNQVFLPAMGRLDFTSEYFPRPRYDVNMGGFYWSGTPGEGEGTTWVLRFNAGSVTMFSASRENGFSVRCVAE